MGTGRIAGELSSKLQKRSHSLHRWGIALVRHLHTPGTFAWARGCPAKAWGQGSAWSACMRQSDQGPPGTCGEEEGTLLGAG